jgi:hypothetical protein
MIQQMIYQKIMKNMKNKEDLHGTVCEIIE